jgi:chemotaxis protein MotA
MRSISLGTLFGIILGFGLFIAAIFFSTDNYAMFFSFSSLLMVVGGTFAAAMISFRGRYVIQTLKDLAGILIPQNIDPSTLYRECEMVIQWGKIIQSDGLRELENHIEQQNIDDPFLKYASDLLVTEYEIDEYRVMLNDAVETTFERNMVQSYILKTMGSYSPAFGMIGTLVGLIIMLDNMGADPSQIGQGLALALITTLYGVLLAKLVFQPAAEKIKEKQEIKRFRNIMIMEGMLLLADRQGSAAIQDRMNSFLDPDYHFQVVQKESYL